MILFQVEGVQKHYGPEPVLDGVTFDLRPGERIGLVGPNGTGKTTLMRILANKEEADGGSIVRHPTLHAGYLEQQPEWEPGRTLLDEAKSGLAGLMAMEAEMISVAKELGRCDDPLEHKRLANRYDHLQHEMRTLRRLQPRLQDRACWTASASAAGHSTSPSSRLAAASRTGSCSPSCCWPSRT